MKFELHDYETVVQRIGLGSGRAIVLTTRRIVAAKGDKALQAIAIEALERCETRRGGVRKRGLAFAALGFGVGATLFAVLTGGWLLYALAGTVVAASCWLTFDALWLNRRGAEARVLGRNGEKWGFTVGSERRAALEQLALFVAALKKDRERALSRAANSGDRGADG